MPLNKHPAGQNYINFNERNFNQRNERKYEIKRLCVAFKIHIFNQELLK